MMNLLLTAKEKQETEEFEEDSLEIQFEVFCGIQSRQEMIIYLDDFNDIQRRFRMGRKKKIKKKKMVIINLSRCRSKFKSIRNNLLHNDKSSPKKNLFLLLCLRGL